jgi:hypothetical protein
MPIRVTDDNSAENNNIPNDGGNNNPGNRGGGGGFSGAFLGIIINLLFKNPKIGIPLLIIGGLFFFFGKGCMGGGSSQSQSKSSYSTGCSMKQEVYAQADQFEKLDEIYNPLPEAVTLQEFCPPVGNQGQQGSCVAWSSSYAARSILNNISTGNNPRNTIFSPAFLYNQIGLEGCQGAYINNAMENLQTVGDVTIDQFPYDENDCSRQPSQTMKSDAAQYRIKGFNRLSKDANKYEVDMLAIKQNIAQGAPVIIGMAVGGSFMEMMGQEMWIPNDEDYQKNGFGGHAMCLVGYDDYKDYNGKKIGAFQIMNSWGPEYGKNGFIWVPYQVFQEFVSEAYGLYPMGKANTPKPDKLEIEFGLLDVAQQKDFAMAKTAKYQYSTNSKIAAGTKFKIKVKNNLECYTYVFAQETDGSTYNIFPYTKKHSPYCGITGTRTFPKDKFFEPDNIGNKDYFAILVSSKPLNFLEINAKLSKSTASSYEQKFVEVFGNEMSSDFKFNSDNNIAFSASLKDNAVAFVVIEVNK